MTNELIMALANVSTDRLIVNLEREFLLHATVAEMYARELLKNGSAIVIQGGTTTSYKVELTLDPALNGTRLVKVSLDVYMTQELITK